jgi:hypothetical protein
MAYSYEVCTGELGAQHLLGQASPVLTVTGTLSTRNIIEYRAKGILTGSLDDTLHHYRLAVYLENEATNQAITARCVNGRWAYSYGGDEHNGEYVEHDGYQALAIYFIRGEAIIDVAQQPPPPIAHELELTMKELSLATRSSQRFRPSVTGRTIAQSVARLVRG